MEYQIHSNQLKIDSRRSAVVLWFRLLSAGRNLSILNVSSILAIFMHSDDEPRKRTARACDSCYRRKVSKAIIVAAVIGSLNCGCWVGWLYQIKCDAAQPQCEWCSHHDLPCTYDRVVTRKRKAADDAGYAQIYFTFYSFLLLSFTVFWLLV